MAAEGNKMTTISIGIDFGWIYQHAKFYDSFQEICQQTRRNLKLWWTNERTDNNTHKPQWQPHFSKVIWPQYPNPRPCTVGRTDELMKRQQYHQHQCRLMIRHLDTSACQMLCHYSKWFVSETAWLNRCYKTVEIKWSMSYPCLMIPIMSSSIRFELKLISCLPANAQRPERVTNDRRAEGCINTRGYSYIPPNLFGNKMRSVIKNLKITKRVNFVMMYMTLTFDTWPWKVDQFGALSLPLYVPNLKTIHPVLFELLC